VIVVGQYRVRLRANIGGLTADALSDWAFGTLDVLLEDPTVVGADVAATLSAGDVEFDLQLRAGDMNDAMRLGLAALDRASASSVAAGVPDVEHAEVDLVPIPA
jgi:hypothetical protein